MTKREKQQCLCKWWDAIPQGSANKMRDKILEVCQVSPKVFWFWCKGTTEIPNMAITLIEQAIGEPIFEEVMV